MSAAAITLIAAAAVLLIVKLLLLTGKPSLTFSVVPIVAMTAFA